MISAVKYPRKHPLPKLTLSDAELSSLLQRLCVEQGFCSVQYERIAALFPCDVEVLTEAIIESDFAKPEYMSRDLKRQVRTCIDDYLRSCYPKSQRRG